MEAQASASDFAAFPFSVLNFILLWLMGYSSTVNLNFPQYVGQFSPVVMSSMTGYFCCMCTRNSTFRLQLL